MDLGTAQKYGFKVGQQVRILLLGPTRTFTIVGLARFGTADNLAGATLAAFDTPTAQALLGEVGQFDAINVVTPPGADKAAVQRAIARVLPRGVEVVTGQTVVNEQTSAIGQALGFLNTALLVFAFIALFVGGFTILNTFSIIVGQRTRELALLRIVGASRRQVFRSVLGEAAIVGLVSSLDRPRARRAGGDRAREAAERIRRHPAVGPPRVRGAHGHRLPRRRRRRDGRLGHQSGPPGRAHRPGGRGHRDQQTEDEILSAAGSSGAGSSPSSAWACSAVGLSEAGHRTWSGLGAVLIFVGVAMLAPAVARPMASVIGRPLARLLGTSGRLGRENSMRSPRRTAQTASALMVGLALVSAIAVFGASLSRSATSSVDNAISADLIVSTTSNGTGTAASARPVPQAAAVGPGRHRRHDRLRRPVRVPPLASSPILAIGTQNWPRR